MASEWGDFMQMRILASAAAAIVMMVPANANAQMSRSQAERIALAMHNVVLPQEFAAALDHGDRKYNSAGCHEARKGAESYQDIDAQTAALAGVGLVLAIVGSPVVVGPNPGVRRMRYHRVLLRHCVTDIEPINAAMKELKKRLDIELQDRQAGTTRYEPVQ